MQFCVKCGSKLEESSKFCQFCGNPMDTGQSEHIALEKNLYVHPESTSQMKINSGGSSGVEKIPVNQNKMMTDIRRVTEYTNERPIQVNNPATASDEKNVPTHQKAGKRQGIQQLLSEAPKSVSFVTSAILSTLLQLPIMLFPVVFLIDGEYLGALLVFGVWVPILIFLIGQWVFLANGLSRSEEMSTAGMTVMKVSVVIQLLFQGIYFILNMIITLQNIEKVKHNTFSWYLYSDSREEYISSQKTKIVIRFIVMMIIIILNFAGYVQSLNIINTMKEMKRTDQFPKNNLPSALVVILCLKGFAMFFIALKFFIASGEFYSRIDELSGYAVLIGIIFIMAGIYYFVLATSIVSFGNKMAYQRKFEQSRSRVEVSQKNPNKNGWKCLCGVVNSSYTGTCGCGRTKNEVLNPQSVKRQETIKKEIIPKEAVRKEVVAKGESSVAQKTKKVEVDENSMQERLITDKMRLENILKLKEMLDAGVITQAEFDHEKKKLLSTR